MNTKEIISRLEYKLLKGSLDQAVTGICFDSRKVKPGDVFVCIRGASFDSHDALTEIDSGNPALIIVDESCDLDLSVVTSTIISTSDTRHAKAVVSAAFYGYPAERLKMVGVTGSKGKTTVTTMIMASLREAGYRAASIGSNGVNLGDEVLEVANTTPDSDQMQKFLSIMVSKGIEYAVLECSSQGLMQHRTDMINFDVGVFLNIQHGDHVGTDEHPTFENYAYCKSLLLQQCNTGIINLDDENIDFASIDEKYYAQESINPIIANAVEVESVEEKLLVVPVHRSFTEKTDTDNKKSTDEITEKTIIEQNDEGADIRNNTVVAEQSVIHENTESCIAEQTSQPEGDKILEPETVPHNTHCEVLIKDDIDYSKKILTTLRWILALVIVVLACVGAYFIYDIGRDNGTKAYYKHNSAVESRKEKIPNNNPVDVEKTDIASVSDKSVEKPQQKAEVNSDKKTVDENSAATNPNDIYNKDARVRTGAYNIIGLDQMVTVRAGQTLKGISKAYFGEGMECYIEAYNGVTSVKEGDTLRIPKLQLKKKSKKK